MTYVAYFLLILSLGFGLILAEPGSVWQIMFTALAISGHGLAFIKVTTQRKLMRTNTGIFGKYPELASMAAVGLVWVFVTLIHDLPVLLVAIGVISALIVCYGAVRWISIAVTNAGKLTPLPEPPGANSFAAARLAMRVIYFLRVGLAAGAVGYLLMLACGVPVSSLWVPLLSGLVMILVVGLVLLTYQTEKTEYHRRKAAHRLHISANLLAKSPEITIYYSSKAKKHARLISLIADLTRADFRFNVICREPGPLAVIKTKTPHAYMAHSIYCLDAFATPSLKVVLYLNDAEKNGHFVRFNQLQHVFLAEAHHVLNGLVPRNYAIYDMLVAPNQALFDQWRAPVNQGLNSQLSHIDTASENLPLTQALALPSPDGALVLGCSIHPAHDPNSWQEKQAWLNALITAVTTHKDPTLRLLLRFEQAGPDWEPMQKALISNLEHYAKQVEQIAPQSLPQIQVTKGNTNDCFNWADILICDTVDNLTALSQTGKPLIFSRDKTDQIPKDIYFLDKESSNLAGIIKKITAAGLSRKPNASVPDSQSNPRSFVSLTQLLDAALAKGDKRDDHG